MNRIKQSSIVFLTIMWTLSWGNLQAQSVKYGYDAAGNRINRTVGTNSPASAPNSHPGGTFKTSSSEETGKGSFVEKVVDGKVIQEYQPVVAEQLPDGINGAVHSAFLLPAPAEATRAAFLPSPTGPFAPVPTSATVDQTKAVGEIPITSDVTNGAVIYTIPLESYPGRHGFQPNIALTYNSMSGNGIAGYGWHISGLSAITPVHSNYYYGGVQAPPEKLGTDATYSLDGVRLMRKSAGNYQTEQGLIMASINDTGNKYFFTVTFPDGRKATYGYTNSTTPQVSYPLTSVTDPAGNFINYTYQQVSNSYVVTEITYGCNGTTIGKITFTYTPRTDGVSRYLAGTGIRQDRLLSSIRVYVGSSLLRTYTLEHTLKEYEFLSKVKCQAGNKELNPLSFHYGSGSLILGALRESTSYLSSYFSTTKNIMHKYKHNNLVVQEGLVSYPQFSTYGVTARDANGNASYGSLYAPLQLLLVYKSLNDFMTSPTSLTAGTGFQALYPVDIDGDGKDELLRINYYYNASKSRVQLTSYNQNMAGTTTTFDLPGFIQEGSLYSPVPRAFLTGNFTGDGRTKLLTVSGNKTPKNTSAGPSYLTLVDLRTNALPVNKTVFEYDHFKDALFAMDFDGDGRTELCLVNNSGLHIYTYNEPAGTFTKLVTYGGITNSDLRTQSRKLLLGDLNGDGKTDILLSPRRDTYTFVSTQHLGTCYGCCQDRANLDYKSGNDSYYSCTTSGGVPGACIVREVGERIYHADAYKWKLFTSTGVSFTASDITFGFPHDDELNDYLLHDLNGDHQPDLVVKNNTQLSLYFNKQGAISTSTGFGMIIDKDAYLIPAITADTRMSDNRMGELLAIKDATVSSLTYTRNDQLERSLSGVVNSLGVINKITYAPMSQSSVYLANTASAYPYNTLFMNYMLVSSREVWHNNNRIEHLLYKYENGTIHRQGLGFCGFRKITVSDQIRSANTVMTYDPAYSGALTSVQTPVSKSTFTYRRTMDANMIISQWITTKTEQDLLNQVTVTSNYQHDTYGNILEESIQYGTAEVVNISNKYNNSPRIGELYDQTIKTTRSGNVATKRMHITSFETTTRQPKTIVEYVNGNQVKQVTNEYAAGNLTKVVEKPYASTGLTTMYEYDNYGRLKKEISPLNLATTYTYKTTTGELATVTNHKNKQTAYEYDDFSRLNKTTYPDGTIETAALTWTTAPTGAIYRMTVTATGKPTGETYYDAFHRQVRDGSAGFDGRYQYTDYQYHTKGYLQKQSQPFRGTAPTAWTTYDYDVYDRPVKMKTPSGNVQTWAYGAGRDTTITNGVRVIRIFDAAGKLVSVSDPAGTITYTSRADGQLTSVTAPGNVSTSFEYDEYGRLKKRTDPSFGVTNYTYNTAGKLYTETDANNKKTEYGYDSYLRLKTKTTPEQTVTYTYNTDGMLAQESTNKNTSTVYTYDDLFRPAAIRENVPDGKWLQKDLTYASGNISSVKYTSNTGVIGTENLAYANGHLTERKMGTTSFFKLTAQNDLGQPTTVTTGGVTRSYGYNANGLLTARSGKAGSTTFQNFSYKVDPIKGNLEARTDSKYNKSESFDYDELNRLKKYGTHTVTFDVKGNILTKSDAGTLSYATPGKPYAVSGATNPASATPARAQNVTYTSFSRPDKITENNYTATFSYNGNHDRVKMHLQKGTARELTRYYIGGCYEIDETGTSNVKEKLYIGGDYYSAPAVYVKENSGAWQIYNICRDHLGSITHLTNSSGSAVTQELSFDAWGRLRNPSTQAAYTPGSEPALFLGRGYTGHEHLPWFGLVNMNARLYDPVTGRFLAPDPQLQAPNMSQNYNRYAYAMNNPLAYKDENGEFIFTILSAIFCPVLLPAAIGADLGLWAGGSMANGTINPFKWDYSSGQTWGYMAGGAAMGGLSGWAGGAIAGSGIPFANTASIAGASLINSAGTSLYTGGKTDISMSFGIGSFNFSKGQFGYLGKSGNKWYENMGYSLGAMANLSDILAGFHPESVQLTTESSDAIGHSAITLVGETDPSNSFISVGPDPGGPWIFNPFKFKTGTNNWTNYVNAGNDVQKVIVKGINIKTITTYGAMLDNGVKYNLYFSSCVNHTARALSISGALSIGIHPYILHAQMYLRSLGVYPYSSSYLLNQY